MRLGMASSSDKAAFESVQIEGRIIGWQCEELYSAAGRRVLVNIVSYKFATQILKVEQEPQNDLECQSGVQSDDKENNYSIIKREKCHALLFIYILTVALLALPANR